MDPSQITNYDVLVEPPISGMTGDYQFAKHKNHVGNNRLQVFLNLKKPSYDQARRNRDFNQCNNIVEEIIETVCHKAVPRGRFLVSSSVDGETVSWNLMNEGMAKTLLHQVFQPEEQPKDQPTKLVTTQPNQSDEGQKRRRRSSLLRRSASESMVGSMFADSKKKLTRMNLCQEEPTWQSSASHNHLTPSRMDLIMTADRDALDPNSQSVGNNRLHVLVTMKSSGYQQASIDGREAILDEVLQTVKTFWNGRFLVQGQNGHEELSKDEARNALRSIFDKRTGGSLSKRHSLATPNIMDRPQAPPTGLLSKQVSMPVLFPKPKIDMPDVSDLQIDAVRSLQKQKQRQNIASRLEQNTRRSVLAQTPAARLPMARNPLGRHSFQPSPFSVGAQAKRESTVLGKLDASVMAQLELEDCDDDDPEPLPPTRSNKFGSQFGGRDSFVDRQNAWPS